MPTSSLALANAVAAEIRHSKIMSFWGRSAFEYNRKPLAYSTASLMIESSSEGCFKIRGSTSFHLGFVDAARMQVLPILRPEDRV